ncbi:Sodium-dependent dicarboxylate transporter SdcS [Rubripirellula lacrimiformis]|uniref:Sodium-dependent dicarboxylate transporter SdcS n=1 Tax=Rubripirellula lacrimiformis TaxID=1930273 RepID=A0A517NIV1_9BACT|nr:SLC13 family permease [Rubripirellula lacrimiformis]QDT07066.1 Sodium-dependent dicarboxylate transporter SdcS [Rubripirellula lacrimiformis]
MNTEIWIVTGVLLATIIAFVLDRFRLDVVAFVSMLALLLTGILTPAEATAGFSNSLVLMIAGLFVVGGAILESGVADLAGRWLGRLGGTSTIQLTVTVMIASALLSAFLSSTGTVAVMLPVVLSLGRRAEVSPTKLLIPLAFGASLGGMLTLIGTPPNMVVNQELRDAGLDVFGFFSFAPAGILMLTVGIVFMSTIGTRLLPTQRTGARDLARDQGFVSRPELMRTYGVDGQIREVRVPDGSKFAGRTLRELGLRTTFHVNVLAVSTPTAPGAASRGPVVRKCDPDTLLLPGDTLFVKASSEDAIANLVREGQMELMPSPTALPREVHLAELIIPPRSEFIGRTVRDVDFFRIYGAMVLSLQDGIQPVSTRTSDTPLGPGDTMLVAANLSALNRLRKSRSNVLLVSEQEEDGEAPLAPAAWWVVVILLGMLIAMSTGMVANVTAVLVAATLMVFTGAFRGSNVYQSINWESIVMIASVMPLATALEKTGTLDLVVDTIVESPGLTSPPILLLLLFVVTSLLSQAISNTATSVLVAPLALQLAQQVGVSPYPLLMGVALAASTAFATPVASPINALVAGAGNYRFGDFLKVGVPLQLLILVATLAIVPLLFPFNP